jgi:HEAT repeat protein
LETIFKIALSMQSHPPPSNGVEVWDVLHTMAFNPNTPVPLLIQLLQNENSSVRIAAAVSPRLPKSEKVAYLKRASASADFSERHLVARDPDTPAESLEKLALDPITAEDVARNPNTATGVLEMLANSKTEWTRRQAMDALSRRREAH